LGITRLGHVGLVVPNVDSYGAFLSEALGMREVRRSADCRWLALNSRDHQVRLREGQAPACDGIGLDVDDLSGLQALRERVEEAGLEITRDEPVDDSAEHGFSFSIPSGPTVELCAGVHSSPPAGDRFDPYRTRGAGLEKKIRKLGHVTIGTPDVQSVEDVFVNVLGFRISDRFPGVISWARCNADHHSVGFAPAVEPGVHHIAFELESFALYEQLADRLARLGTRLVWGPGRHGPGNNLFAYFVDPGGTLVEIYSDLIQIENEHNYVATDWDDLQEVGNRWGPLPDESWFKMLTPFTTGVLAES
jgi:catechol 2,3-dioxygenase